MSPLSVRRPLVATLVAAALLSLSSSAEAMPPRLDESTTSLEGVLIRNAADREPGMPAFSIVVNPGTRSEARFPLVVMSNTEGMAAVALANQLSELASTTRPYPDRFEGAPRVELRGKGVLTGFGAREIAVWAFDVQECRPKDMAAQLARDFERLLRSKVHATGKDSLRRAYDGLLEAGVLAEFFQDASKLAAERR